MTTTASRSSLTLPHHTTPRLLRPTHTCVCACARARARLHRCGFESPRCLHQRMRSWLARDVRVCCSTTLGATLQGSTEL